MDAPSTIMTVVLVLLVAMSAFFSSTETAFSSLNRIRLKSRAEDGSRRAQQTLRLSERYDDLLSTILVGNNIVNITATTIGTVLFTDMLGPTYGPTVSTVVLTVVILIFGEISPKSLSKESPEAVAMAATPAMRFLVVVLKPINLLFSLWKRLLVRLFHNSPDTGITEAELVTMVSEAEHQGGLDQHESQLIRAAIEFNDLEVGEILTPRVDVVAVEDTATAEELAATFAEHGYSRLPVYHESIDNIVGIVHEKDFYAARYHQAHVELSTLVAPVLYTTPTTKISDLIRILQGHRAHMAVVVDEYGGTDGIVTLEDILEELVGEIWDEHDEVIEQVKKQEDGSYLIACSTDLTDLRDLFSLRTECDAATVSGWVMEQIGRVPEVGDHFVCDHLDVTVTQVDHRRVLEIRVAVLDQEDQEKD